MSKLLRAGFNRLWKDKIFWICMAAMFILATFLTISVGKNSLPDFYLDRLFFIFVLPLIFVCGVFVSLFIGTDYSDGTVRNKIIVGHSRIHIYLTNLIVCIVAGFLFICAYTIPVTVIGLIMTGQFLLTFPHFLIMSAIALMMMIAVSSLFTMMSMLNQNKAIVAVSCLICAICLFCIAAWCNSKLQEPEYYDGYTYMDDTGTFISEEKHLNPNYISGTEREIYQFVLEFQPAGQAIIFVETNFIHTWELMVYSLVIALITTTVGLYVFRKKDIK